MATVLITGASKRLGAQTATFFHNKGFNLLLSYLQSQSEAESLSASFNNIRDNSCQIIKCDLNDSDHVDELANIASEVSDLSVLINNASSFFPSPLGKISNQQWDQLINSNLKAPLFLSQALAPRLSENKGSIINMVDIHGYRPLNEHTVYCVAKSGLMMLTQSLALELAPDVRVNAVAPGAILWPENNSQIAQNTLPKIPLHRAGHPEDIAKAIYHLAVENQYITGQILPVDGGRTLNQ